MNYRIGLLLIYECILNEFAKMHRKLNWNDRKRNSLNCNSEKFEKSNAFWEIKHPSALISKSWFIKYDIYLYVSMSIFLGISVKCNLFTTFIKSTQQCILQVIVYNNKKISKLKSNQKIQHNHAFCNS